MFIHPGHIITDSEPKKEAAHSFEKLVIITTGDLPRPLHSVTLHTNECLLIVFQFTAAV
jgi:hypothetical protein